LLLKKQFRLFSQKSSKLPIPAMVKIYDKHSNRHNFISVQDIDTILRVW